MKHMVMIILVLKFLSPQTEVYAAVDSIKCPNCGKMIVLIKDTANSKHDGIDVENKGHDDTTAVQMVNEITESDKLKTPENLSEGKVQNISKNFFFSYLTYVFVLAILILLYFFMVFIPAKRKKSLIDALEIIDGNIESRFQEADDLLTRALRKGLKDKDIIEATFAQVYIRARLQRYADASVIMEELKKIVEVDKHVAYLDLWLQSQLKKHHAVESLFTKHSKLLENVLDTNMIASIAYLELGKHHWSRNEFENAIHYFDKVKKLELLKNKLPKNIEDHQIIFGIMSLYDGKIDEAKRYFKSVISSSEQVSKQKIHGEIGLLLCEWRAQEHPNIDLQLTEIIETLQTQHWIDQSMGQDSVQEDILKKSIYIWHAVSLILTWFRLPEKKGLPSDERMKLAERLNRIKELDITIPDSYLIEGLVDYFFFHETAHEPAIELIEKAIENGVNVPEVIHIINQERKLKEQQTRTLELFLSLLKKYLNDKSIPATLRKELKARLSTFSRFKDMEKGLSIGNEEDEVMPSLSDLQNRSSLLHKRVDSIVKPQLVKMRREDSENITNLLTDLENTTKGIVESTKVLESTEHELMLRTGEFLLKEESVTS